MSEGITLPWQRPPLGIAGLALTRDDTGLGVEPGELGLVNFGEGSAATLSGAGGRVGALVLGLLSDRSVDGGHC